MTGNFDKDFELLIDFMRSGVDDRSLAIITASYVDKYLGEIIGYRLPGLNQKLRQKLFDPANGMLGGFAARIDIATALGQLKNHEANNLKAIASIRNRFAHELSISSFEHPEIDKRVANLKPPVITGADGSDQNELIEKWDKVWKNRAKFEMVVMLLCTGLHNTLVKIRNIESGTKD